ncbi:hypothetical protein F2Q69_00006199 [Brassica cretica]|uniref:Uncharacterized protein n=1 Tax=Brassica cretica TaxID=69181 RepID=A0A8S9NNX2_BRACR|nr:hypothetical protein F2Q69_00006199 [Brassica cretica]
MTAYLEHVFSKRLDAVQSMVERLPGQILRRSGRTEMSETRDPFQNQQRIPGTEAGADTRTGRSKRQKGWQCPRRQTSFTSLSQRRSWSMF